MKIDNVILHNIDSFYDLMESKLRHSQYKMAKFGRNFSQLMNHISVTLELSDVTDYEYIYLKMYSTSITEKIYDKMIDEEYIENNYPEVYEALSSLIPFVNRVNEEFGDNKYTDYIMPLGAITSSVVITLSGSQLISGLVTLEPSMFFIQSTNGECLYPDMEEKGNEMRFKPGFKINEEEFKNYIIRTFISNFYKFMLTRYSYVDIVSDAYNNTYFMNHGDNELFISSIQTPFFSFDATNEDGQSLLTKISDYKIKSNNLHTDRKFKMKNTYFEVCIQSSFSVFSKLFEMLPYESFTSMDNFQIPNSNFLNGILVQCPDELRNSFENRFIGRLSQFAEKCKTNLDDKTLLKQIEMTPGYIPYLFSIKISFSDIDNYILPYLEDESKKSFTDLKTKEIIENILNFTKKIYSYL